MKKIRRHWPAPFLILLTTLVAYGQTLLMYFWIDDNALIYKLQHIDQAIGFWGKGAVGQGPYRHIVNQFVPFYPFFKTNPTPYYAVGILLYFLAALTVYLFTKRITKNKKIALASAIIFASGYVGSEAVFGLVNSWQTSRGIVISLFAFWFYWRFMKSKKKLSFKGAIYYLLSLVVFYLSLETVFIRAHGLIFAFFLFDILFWPLRLKAKSIIGFLLRQIPFFYVHYKIYLTSPSLVRNFGILKILEKVFVEKKYVLLSIPFQDLGNLFIPDQISSLVDKVISQSFILPTELSVGATLLGVIFLVFFFYLIRKYRKTEKFLTKILVFAVFWMVANFIIFYAREPEHTLWSTHRYFSYSFVGLALFWATALYLIRKRFNLIVVGLILVYLCLGLKYQYQFNNKRSIPARRFFHAFDQYLPDIPRGSILFFDLANDKQVRGEFGSFFGGMFSEGSNLAIYSQDIDYMNDFLFTYDFNDVLEQLKSNQVKLNQVYSFYYDKQGLADNTHKVRDLLSLSRKIEITESRLNGDIKIIPPEDTPSLVPVTLNFSLRLVPRFPDFPYLSSKDVPSIEPAEKKLILDYLASRARYRKESVPTSASFWKEQVAKLALDGRLDTAWRGHRGFWDEIFRGRSQEVEYLQVDLGKPLIVSRVDWFSAQRPLVPTHYRILTSYDGKKFDLANEVKRSESISEGTRVIDHFEPSLARFVKMEIIKTFGNDGPEIKEFEVIEEKYAHLSQSLVEKVSRNPFARIDSPAEYYQALAYIKENATMRVYWMSDADLTQDPTKYVEIPLIVDGQFHQYSLALPVTGRSWIYFTIEGINFPAEVSIRLSQLLYKAIEEIK